MRGRACSRADRAAKAILARFLANAENRDRTTTLVLQRERCFDCISIVAVHDLAHAGWQFERRAIPSDLEKDRRRVGVVDLLHSDNDMHRSFRMRLTVGSWPLLTA